MKRKLWWISCSIFNWFNKISLKSKEKDVDFGDGVLYFESEKEAEVFVEKLKIFILENYPRARQERWFQE